MTLPTDVLLAKIAAGLGTRITCVGDSTVQGVGDFGGDGFAFATSWIGRLAAFIGAKLDINVTSQTGSSWYRSSLGSSAPKMVMANYSLGGTTTAYQTAGIPVSLAVRPDIVLIRSGLNDMGLGALTPAQLSTAMQTFISTALDKWNDIVIIPMSNYTYGTPAATYLAGQSRMMNDLVGQSIPFTTPLLQSPSNPLVWALDLRQAIANTSTPSSYMSDGLHPNAAGYRLEATWMLGQLFATDITPPTITTSILQPLAVGVGSGQRLSATSTTPVTWTVTGGMLPGGLTLDKSSGLLAGTPTNAGSYDFTVNAANGNLPDATQRYTGTIAGIAVDPFTARTSGNIRYRLIDQFYPITPKVKAAGAFTIIKPVN